MKIFISCITLLFMIPSFGSFSGHYFGKGEFYIDQIKTFDCDYFVSVEDYNHQKLIEIADVYINCDNGRLITREHWGIETDGKEELISIALSYPEDEHKFLLNGSISLNKIEVLLGSKKNTELRHQFSIEFLDNGIKFSSREWDINSRGVEFLAKAFLERL